MPELGIYQDWETEKYSESGKEKSNLNPLIKSCYPVIPIMGLSKWSKPGTLLLIDVCTGE